MGKPKLQKPNRNLASMIQQLEGVQVSIEDIEQLTLQVMFESDRSFDKINALKVLVDIKKNLNQDKNESELLSILKGE